MTVSTLSHRIFEILDVSRGFEDSFRSYDRSRYLDESMASKEELSPCIFDFPFQTSPQGTQVNEAAYTPVYLEGTPEEASAPSEFGEKPMFIPYVRRQRLQTVDRRWIVQESV